MESKEVKVFTNVKVNGMTNFLIISKYLWLDILAYALSLKNGRIVLKSLSKSVSVFSLSEEAQSLLEKIFIDVKDTYQINFDFNHP